MVKTHFFCSARLSASRSKPNSFCACHSFASSRLAGRLGVVLVVVRNPYFVVTRVKFLMFPLALVKKELWYLRRFILIFS